MNRGNANMSFAFERMTMLQFNYGKIIGYCAFLEAWGEAQTWLFNLTRSQRLKAQTRMESGQVPSAAPRTVPHNAVAQPFLSSPRWGRGLCSMAGGGWMVEPWPVQLPCLVTSADLAP